MKRVLLCLCAVAVCLSFAGEYSVDLPKEGIEGRVIALEISGEQLRNLGGHPAWLRLYDAKGSIVPWAREQATAKTISHSWQSVSTTIDLVRKLDDGALEITFHTAPDLALSDDVTLEFKTDVRNFGMQVKIYGKEAGGAEHELKMQGSGYIFDSTENIDARELKVTFSPGKCRAFKVALSSAKLERISPERSVSVTKGKASGEITNEKVTVVEQPFSLKGLELWSQASGMEVSRPQTQKLSVPFDKVKVADGKSIYRITPGVTPVTNMEFEFAEENYSRKITVKDLLRDGSERVWATGVVSRISIGDVGHGGNDGALAVDGHRGNDGALAVDGLRGNDGALAVDGLRGNGGALAVDGHGGSVGTLQLTIEDNDNPPLTLTKVSLIIPLYRLKFVARPEQFPLRLTAIPNADEPVYDVASILSLGGNALNVRVIHPGVFTGEAINADAATLGTGIPRVYLFIAVGLAVVVMGAAIAFTLKRND